MTRATQVSASQSQTTRLPQHTEIAIVGSGFSGLGAAVKLDEAGHKNFIVLERGNDVGGTWRDNSYPGAACDVPSHLYSYSFALNPEWTRSFSTQTEIQNYIRGVAERAGVLDRHVFNCHVKNAVWREQDRHWELSTAHGTMTANVVIGAFGALAEPSLPGITGIDDFDGQLFHSAQWNHDAELTGKRVAVIGTGASGIQIVPAIVDEVAHLDVYQRTAPWLLPRLDRPFTRVERWAFRNIPGVLALARAGIYAVRETQVVGLAKNPRLMKLFELLSRLKIRTEIKDPELRRKVTPNFRIGCKRMLISNDWYPALDREHVELVTDGIREVKGRSIITEDGTAREVDAIIVATGFHVTDSPMFDAICGADGKSLSQTFADKGMRAYKGSTIAGYPNMFILIGPNTGLGHTSMVYMIESQLNYVVDAVNNIKSRNITRIDVRQDVFDDYNDALQRKLAGTVWMTGGCASWYLDAHGNNTTLWPDFTFRFRRQTKRFDLDAYETSTSLDAPTAAAASQQPAGAN
ncbi:MAG: hypothetical protein QOF15_369 [Mycobacterium sp.]|nr:hypothetical protein [Mycobacterium sp.]